jgi:quercetin dioxygenase-like cupin family protein
LIRALFTILLLTLCVGSGTVLAQAAAPIPASEVRFRTQVLRDTTVSVYLLHIPPSQASVMHRHNTDLLTVFLSGGATSSRIGDRPAVVDSIPAGEVRFRPPGFTHATENVGTRPFRAVIFEFPSSVGAVRSSLPPEGRACVAASEGACVIERTLLCTDAFCVKRITMGPGSTWENAQHSQKQIVVAVTDFKLVSDGEASLARVERRTGEIAYWPNGSAAHWKNRSAITVVLVDVIFNSDDRRP